MKVLILANNSVGLYKFRKELLEALLCQNNEVYISIPNGEFISDIVQMGCKFIDTQISRRGTNPFTDLLLILQYKKIIKTVQPDIVFTYTIKPNVYGGFASQLCGVPYVANVTGLGSAVENGGILQKITLALYKVGIRGAQKVFFQNQANFDFMLAHGIKPKSHALIPGSGVNLERFAPLPYPQNDDTVHFVFISRIMREKGIDQYLDAALHFYSLRHCEKRSDEAIQECVFHVCGFCEAEYQGKLDELAKAGVVVYHGMVRDVKTVLKDVHCTIHPSFYPEGISNVLLESCASARPIITTDRSGCREVVDDEINGFVVKQRDSQDLIEKIEKFLALTHEQKLKMGEAGRAKVEKIFDRKLVVKSYLNELEKIK